MNPTDFANKIRTKYPGAYDNVPDEELTQRVIAKYPVYANKVNISQTNTAQPPRNIYDSNQDNGFINNTINKVRDVGVGVANALTSSEQKFGKDIAAASTNFLPESLTGVDQIKHAAESHAQEIQNLTTLIKNRRAKGINTSSLEKQLNEDIKNGPPQLADLYPEINKSALQVLGDAGGVALDITAAGSLKGVKGFGLAPELTKTAEEAAKAKEAYNALSTGGKVLSIAKDTAKTAATGAAIGYGYDVTQKAQNNEADLKPGLGTAIGAGVPLVIGGIKIAGAISKDQAPRIVNSLIGTKKGDFKYGKNPGRAIAETGMTANSLPDLENKVTQARQTAGSTIGEITTQLEGKAEVNINDALNPIDEAIKTANKAPRTNSSLIQRLQNVKDDLLGITTDASGNSIPTRDLNDPSFANAFELKKTVGDITKFTGNPSDDGIVNGALKRVYGNIKGAMNNAALEADPELGKQLVKANERYADFTSAEVALKNRIALNQGKNLVSMPIKVGTAAGVITSIASGGVALPAILVGVGAGVLDKALASTAVKTRIAAWLGKESPEVIAGIVEKNPGIGAVLKKAFSKEYTPIENILNDARNIPNKEGGFISIGGKIKSAEDHVAANIDQLIEKASEGANLNDVLKNSDTAEYLTEMRDKVLKKGKDNKLSSAEKQLFNITADGLGLPDLKMDLKKTSFVQDKKTGRMKGSKKA